MPRGRPRKNPIAPIATDPEIKTTAKENIAASEKNSVTSEGEKNISPIANKFSPLCDRCHNPIPTGERNINLSILTNMASWHRDVSIDRVKLCPACAKELNSLIDKWLINDGKGISPKWLIQEKQSG